MGKGERYSDMDLEDLSVGNKKKLILILIPSCNKLIYKGKSVIIMIMFFFKSIFQFYITLGFR